jgi:hypothetical protein
MTNRVVFTFVLGAICFGCTIGAKLNATQTLAGVTVFQAISAAGRVVGTEGLDLEEFQPARGYLSTQWQTSSRRRLRYEVRLESASSNGVIKRANSVKIVVTASACDRLVGGWSEPYPIASNAEGLLEKITEIVTAKTDKPRMRKLRTTCKRSDECPAGKHCASGTCLSECSSDNMCGEGEACDLRGRCIPRPPETVVAPPVEAVGDAGPAAPAEDDSADAKKDSEVAR